MPDNTGRPTSPLGDALAGFLKSEGLLEVAREKLCPLIWAEVVGAWYARFTRITRVRDGIVFVRCDSAPRAHQLQLDAPAIIARLNERLGADYIRELRPSSTGSPRQVPDWDEDDGPDPPTDQELAAIELDQTEVLAIRAKAAELEDQELRAGLERILLRRARLQIWQRDHGFTRCPDCGGYYPGSRPYCYACRPAPPPPREGGEEGLSPYHE